MPSTNSTAGHAVEKMEKDMSNPTSENNTISKKLYFETNEKTTSLNIHRTDPVIKVFVNPLITNTADMRKVGNTGYKTHLG